MPTMQKSVATALAGLAAMLGSLAVAAPAQAAPPATLSQHEVNLTTNRSTPVPPRVTRFGPTVELRSGYYQGYQYGWARVVLGRNTVDWKRGDIVWLRILEGGSWRLAHGSSNEFGDGTSYTVTAGQMTRADNNYRFQACLQRYGQGIDTLDCTDPW
jgi:hypothetical protein